MGPRNGDFRNNGSSSGTCRRSIGRNVGTERQQSLGSSSHSLKHLHGRGSCNRCCGGKPEIPACERLGGDGSPRPSACGSTGSVGLSEDLGAETV